MFTRKYHWVCHPEFGYQSSMDARWIFDVCIQHGTETHLRDARSDYLQKSPLNLPLFMRPREGWRCWYSVSEFHLAISTQQPQLNKNARTMTDRWQVNRLGPRREEYQGSLHRRSSASGVWRREVKVLRNIRPLTLANRRVQDTRERAIYPK